MTDHSRRPVSPRPVSADPRGQPQSRCAGSVMISRRDYERLRNAADLLNTVAAIIREILPER